MTSIESRTVVLKTPLDEGMPGPEHFDITRSPAPTKCTGENQVLVQVLAMSADPYLRGRIKSSAGAKENTPMEGFVSGEILDSTDPKWAVGELFGGNLKFSTVQLVDTTSTLLWKLPGISVSDVSLGIGVLGMPGSTSYGGLVDVLQPEKGQTIWVSAAAGAVGSVVGQIAKNVYGCKVIGSAGGAEKCKMVVEKFGFDHCIDYKKANDDAGKLEAMMREVAPEGIDMYFENVGGIHFTVAAKMLRKMGRIAVCGSISQYNSKDYKPDTLSIANMIYNMHRIEGFVCSPWLSGQKGSFHKDMPIWVKEGKVTVEQTKFKGVDNWPMAFRSLFEGGNTGKVVVVIPPSVKSSESEKRASSKRSSKAIPPPAKSSESEKRASSKRSSKRTSKRSSTRKPSST